MSDQPEDEGADGSAAGGSDSGGLSKVDAPDIDPEDRPEKPEDDPALQPDTDGADPADDAAADGDDDAAAGDVTPGDAAADGDGAGAEDGGEDGDDEGGLRKVERDDEDRHRSHKPNTMGPDDADVQAPPEPPFRSAEEVFSLDPNRAVHGDDGDDGPPPGHAAGAPSPGEPVEDDEDEEGAEASDGDGDPGVAAADDGLGDSGTISGMGVDGTDADGGSGADAEAESGVDPDAGADGATPPGPDPDRPAPGPAHGPDPEDGGYTPTPGASEATAGASEATAGVVGETDEYDPVPETDEPKGPPDDEEMPLAEHVEEMVNRLGVVVVAVAVATALAFPLADEALIVVWNDLLPSAPNPHIYGPLEKILTEIKFASLAGVLVALPVLVYESYLFMRPGLYPKERKYYLAAVPTSLVLGAIGMAFAYLLVLPVLFQYFITYSEDGVDKLAFGLQVTFNLIVAMLGAFALVFQIPLLMMLAIMMGVTSRRWIEQRRLYFWGAFLGLGFLMGGADLTGMAPIIIAATMIGLFEGTLVLLRWTGR